MTATSKLSLGLLLNWTLPDVEVQETFDYLCRMCVAAEAVGFDSVWVPDHFSQVYPGAPTDEPVLEAYVVLAALAARTQRVRLGTLVTAVTHRNPAMLAKQVTTIDVISGGRALLGVGAAWNEDEHRAYGLTFGRITDRYDLLSDAIQICRSMFQNPSTTYAGQRISVIDAMNVPQPLTAGGPPILVGGSGEQRTLRIVAEHADIANTTGDPVEQRRLQRVLDGHCESIGRDPTTITRTSLRPVILGDTEADARRAATVAEHQSMGAALSPIVGTAEAVLEGAASYLQAGLDGIIVWLPPAHRTPDHVTAVGQVLAPLWAGVAVR